MPPLTFRPLLKRIRWGGRLLADVLHKPIGPECDYAESWELCDHGNDQSVVAGGPFDGLTLRQLMTTHSTALCGEQRRLRQFPLLIKFLDASDRLSVQVHPNDVQARFFNPRENGKTEAWVILDAQPNSRVYSGLKPGIDSFRLQRHLANDTVEECLHSYPVCPGDCIFIPAGTVHAIGEGILLAEVQQSSDLTFRLHDWGRLGNDGQPRELHLEESLVCIDFDRGPVDPVRPRPLTLAGTASVSEELLSCEYFALHRHVLHEPFQITAAGSFHVLQTLNGEGTLRCGNSVLALSTGQTVLLPASSPSVTIVPNGPLTLLDSFLPTIAESRRATANELTIVVN